jgi:hypothetical protein
MDLLKGFRPDCTSGQMPFRTSVHVVEMLNQTGLLPGNSVLMHDATANRSIKQLLNTGVTGFCGFLIAVLNSNKKFLNSGTDFAFCSSIPQPPSNTLTVTLFSSF